MVEASLRARERFQTLCANLLALSIAPACTAELPPSTGAVAQSVTELPGDPDSDSLAHPDINHPEQWVLQVPPASAVNRARLDSQLSAAPVGTIISPVSATIDAGGPGFGSIFDTFSQSGLTAGYTSGVTNFDTYLATVPRHTMIFAGFEWFSNSGTTGAVVTYDLGAAIAIDRLALWNEESSGIGTLDLLSSKDGVTFTPLASGLHPTDNPLTNPIDSPPYAADVFSFAATSARFVRFVISDSPQPDPAAFPGAAIGEVAFRVGSAGDLIARTIDWNAGGDGVDFSYEVTDQDLQQDTTVGLFWAKGPDQADIVGEAFSQAAEKTVGTHDVHATADQIEAAPQDATHVLAVVDHDDTIQEDPTNNQVALRLPHIEVVASANTTDFRLTAAPAMPTIRIRLNDLPAAFVPSLSVDWHTEITSGPGDFPHQVATFSATPIDATVTASDQYQPSFGDQVVGGKLTFTSDYLVAGVQLESTSKALKLRILGTQPDAATIETYVRTQPQPSSFPAAGFGYHDVLLRIMRHESLGGVQFLGDGSPLFNIGRNDGGAGLFQITPPSTAQVWHWQRNADGGARVFNGKMAEAVGWIDTRSVTGAADAVRKQFHLPSSTPVQVVAPAWSRAVMILREGVQRYNGGNAFVARGERVIRPDGTPLIRVTWERAGNGYHEIILGPLTP